MATTIMDNVKNAMLQEFSNEINAARIRFSTGISTDFVGSFRTFSSTVSSGVLTQSSDAQFDINTTMGTDPKDITGFVLEYAETDPEIVETHALIFSSETVYSYPNDGTFTVSGMTITLN